MIFIGTISGIQLFNIFAIMPLINKWISIFLRLIQYKYRDKYLVFHIAATLWFIYLGYKKSPIIVFNWSSTSWNKRTVNEQKRRRISRLESSGGFSKEHLNELTVAVKQSADCKRLSCLLRRVIWLFGGSVYEWCHVKLVGACKFSEKEQKRDRKDKRKREFGHSSVSVYCCSE